MQQHNEPFPQKPTGAAAPSPGPGLSKFPVTFNLYQRAFSRKYHLCMHQDQPLFAVSRHRGFSGKPDVMLHAGPSDKDPHLATAKMPRFRRKMTLELASPLKSAAVQKIDLQYDLGFPHGSYTFTMPVGLHGHNETFEWRHSHGADVRDLGGDLSGWVLLRQETGSPAGARAEDGIQRTPEGSTKDGKEVVFVWSDVEFSHHKAATFRFLGTGATGVFGEQWALAVMVSALAIFEKLRRRKTGAAAGGAGGVGG
jgi:hypothetical protein